MPLEEIYVIGFQNIYVSGFFGISKKDILKITDVVMECFNTKAFGKY